MSNYCLNRGKPIGKEYILQGLSSANCAAKIPFLLIFVVTNSAKAFSYAHDLRWCLHSDSFMRAQVLWAHPPRTKRSQPEIAILPYSKVLGFLITHVKIFYMLY